MKYDVSIVVATFNPDYNKLFITLQSIIIQKSISFEIIIVDDGTELFQKERVEKWFLNRNISDYTIVTNKENKGTVENVYSGVRIAKGKYVKAISPGDMLYDENALNKAVGMLKETGGRIGFGKAVWYRIEEKTGQCELLPCSAPRSISPYLQHNYQKIRYRYLILKDYVLGPSFVLETVLMKEYLEKMLGRIMYADDCSFILMVADGIEIHYLEEFLIWYEYGSGISTSGKDIWNKRLYEDNKMCFSMIKEQHPALKRAYDVTFGRKSFINYLRKLFLYFDIVWCRCGGGRKPDISGADDALLKNYCFHSIEKEV